MQLTLDGPSRLPPAGSHQIGEWHEIASAAKLPEVPEFLQKDWLVGYLIGI